MLNFENDPSSQGNRLPPPGGDQSQLNTLRPEEIKFFKDCTFSLYYKAGLPFAILCHVLSNLKKPDAPVVPANFYKKGFVFFGNILAGSILCTPWCYYKVAQMRAEYEKERRLYQAMPPKAEEVRQFQPVPQAEEFGYPVDSVATLNEPEGTYSSDFESSNVAMQEEKETKKNRPRSYDELRAFYRSRHIKSLGPPPESSPSTDTPTSSENSPRKVTKNKYGDEIE